jgi:hypothetical protein
MWNICAFRSILSDIAGVLEEGRENEFAANIRAALAATNDVLEKFLMSNSLWGGSGSIADSAFGGNKSFDGFDVQRAREQRFKNLMAQLGCMQIEARKTNPRTSMWVEAFRQSSKRNDSQV